MELFGDPLRRRAQELENDLSSRGAFDREAWQNLIAAFEGDGRNSAASSLQARVQHFETMVVREPVYA